MQGMVFKRQVEGDITKQTEAKIAVYTCAVDIIQTETKGTVLIKTADELLKFSSWWGIVVRKPDQGNRL